MNTLLGTPETSHIRSRSQVPGITMVSRCICCNQEFSHVLAVARDRGCSTVAELKEHLHVSAKCGLCIPFIQKVIETGETVIPLMNQEESDALLGRSGLKGSVTER